MMPENKKPLTPERKAALRLRYEKSRSNETKALLLDMFPFLGEPDVSKPAVKEVEPVKPVEPIDLHPDPVDYSADTPPEIPAAMRKELEKTYEKGAIDDLWVRAWLSRQEDLRKVSPFLRSTVLMIRERFQKHAPMGLAGHSDICQRDEDSYVVWRG